MNILPINEYEHAGYDSAEPIETRLSPLWIAAGLPPAYPASDRDVVRLAVAGQYVLTRNDLAELVESGAVCPDKGNSGRRWSAVDINRLLARLELLQRWQATPSVHDAKKSKWRLVAEISEQDGNTDLADEAEARTGEELLALLTHAGTAVDREAIIELIRIKLKQLGVYR